MEAKNDSKKIIIFLSALLLAGSIYLFIVSDRFSSPDKGWWSVSFQDPKSDNFTFYLENYANSNKFHWKISGSDGISLGAGDTEAMQGEIKKVEINLANVKNGKITLSVSDDSGNKKDIYKNLND